MLEQLLAGFEAVANVSSVGAMLTGLALGIVVGALPGLTATMAVAVLTPFTFFIGATIGIPFLLGVYKGAIYGGSIPAITINTPGTAAAAATTIDGHAMALKGETRRALEMSLYASVIADLLSTILLIVVAPTLAAFALRFSSPEFAMLLLFSLTMIAAVSGRSLVKGLLSATLGVGLAVIGLDPMSGVERFTFDVVDLSGGISLVPLLIGMFALSEILVQAESATGVGGRAVGKDRGGRVTLADMKRVSWTILRSTGIGAFLGALPGLGAEISCWIAYGMAKRRSKHPETFGQGEIEGVAAAEAGNNAVCPAALVPMMTFGIPGDTVTAILLGAFMAHGLNPGPLLFQKHAAVVYGFFATLLITNLLLLVLGYGAIRYLRRIAEIPQGLLLPAVAALCFVGGFAVNSSYFDLLIMIGGGVVGYLMRKAGVPVPPLIIALLLAPELERSLRQSLMFSDGSLGIFVTRPIAAGFLVLTVVVVGQIAWRAIRPRSSI